MVGFLLMACNSKLTVVLFGLSGQSAYMISQNPLKDPTNGTFQYSRTFPKVVVGVTWGVLLFRSCRGSGLRFEGMRAQDSSVAARFGV